MDGLAHQEKEMKPFDKCPVCGGELVEKDVEKLLKGGHCASRRLMRVPLACLLQSRCVKHKR